MKNRILLLILIFAIANSSCKVIIKKIYGVKKPAFESLQSIEKFKSDVFGNEYNFAVVRFDNWINDQLLVIPEVYVFDKYGRFIPYKDTARINCNGPAEVFLSLLDSNTVYNYDENLTQLQFLNRLDFPEKKFQQNDSINFYIFITWANWAGKKIIDKKSKEWIKAINSNHHANISLTLVNQDLQQNWSEEQKKNFTR